jgi:DMSO/TMAO reductase YedYZ molybdopterin-dependent catalytic subunit
MNTRDHLPVHTLPVDESAIGAELGNLDVGGLVWRSHIFSVAELGALPRTRLTEPFVCEEGWSVNDLTWEGIPLREVLVLCQPLPEARYVRISAGSYWIALSLSELDHALLCDRLNGKPLAREHGGPWRLVLSGGACFTSVKWVSALELAAQRGDATAERIARGRIATQGAD